MGYQDNPASVPRSRTRRRALQGMSALVLAAGSMAVFGAPSALAAPTTVTFGGGTHTLHLPAGPVTVNFYILAGGGGADGDGANAGGYGGGIVGSFVWKGGKTTVTVIVGEAGGNGLPTGTNSSNGGRGGGYRTGLFQSSLRGHGGNGGTGGVITTGTYAGGGGGGGGATAVLVNTGIVLVAGGGGGASQFDVGTNGSGAGSVKGLVAGGVGKTGQYTQEGGGGGGGGAVNGVGGGGGLPGGGGTGFAHSSGNFVLTPGYAVGTSNGSLGGGPGSDGVASFTGVGIS